MLYINLLWCVGMGQDVAWGRYQAGTSILMALLKMPAAWFQLSLLYLAPDISHRCSHTFNQVQSLDVIFFLYFVI